MDTTVKMTSKMGREEVKAAAVAVKAQALAPRMSPRLTVPVEREAKKRGRTRKRRKTIRNPVRAYRAQTIMAVTPTRLTTSPCTRRARVRRGRVAILRGKDM